MKIKKSLTCLSLLICMYASAQVKITIDANERLHEVSPMLYGIFFEDINHAADGGLYAEMIANRSFEDGENDAPCWSIYTPEGATMSYQIIKNNLLNEHQGKALELNVNSTHSAPACLVNEGFWGMNVVHGQSYRLTFWAKSKKFKGNVVACLCDKTGQRVYAQSEPLNINNKNWTKYSLSLVSQNNDPQAQFVLLLEGKGVIDLDVVSLFPPTFKNRENGCRIDLANMLLQLKPKFMRFPGGCFVEGQDSPDNAFHWEKTIGPIEEREGHLNRNWNYRTSDGLGFHEYLQLSEDLGAKPLYVCNVGIWHGGVTPVDELQPWVDEVLNALEYANGDISTKYGAMRAANGHPAPFNIEYLEIGNENNQPDPRQQSDRYYERFKIFRDAVLAKYPNMHIIGNVVAWGDDNPKWQSNESVELLDEHYYRTPSWFADNYRKYDSYSRSGAKIYCGEYAVTQGFGRIGSLNAALGEAVFMMGMENNGDIVEMASYAPIFVNENNVAWAPDMIRFNSSKAMGTPSYYVQKLMAENVGSHNVKTVVSDDDFYSNALPQLTPKSSKFGYATWGTQSSYQFVSCNSLAPDAKSVASNLAAAEEVKGQWKVTDNTVSQRSNFEGCIFVEGNKIESDNYELKVLARKDGGAEGFIVVFNYEDPQNYCWFNLGGWGNTQHGIEQVINGNKVQTVTRRGHVETGRWYEVTIKVKGDSVSCWLDNNLVFDTRLKFSLTPGLFSNAQLDNETGDMIFKVINTSSESTSADIEFKGFTPSKASLVRLSSASGDDENTISQPTNVYPVEIPAEINSNGFNTVIPPYSLNIYRLKK